MPGEGRGCQGRGAGQGVDTPWPQPCPPFLHPQTPERAVEADPAALIPPRVPPGLSQPSHGPSPPVCGCSGAHGAHTGLGPLPVFPPAARL